MSRVSLVLTAPIGNRLKALAQLDRESGAILLARVIEAADGSIRLLAHRLEEVPEDAYETRTDRELLIASAGYVPALSKAEETNSVAIWLHTHPGSGSIPLMSDHDEIVNDSLNDLFRMRTGSSFYGAMVIAHDEGDISFYGFLDTGEQRFEIERLISVGERMQVAWSYSSSHRDDQHELFDRNVRAFGGAIQRTIGDIRIAIVGVGGTGSAVAEQLVRLGARQLHLIDPDELSLSNVSRVYGSTPEDVGTAKVEVIGNHLTSVAPDANITRTIGTITKEAIARQLADADIIFGCTDDNAGRAILSRLPSYALVPVIDCGVVLSSNANNQLTSIDGRVTVVTPTSPCLVCRGRIDLTRAAAERMSAEEHSSLVEEGYAPALPGVEPAVVAYTTAVAAAAVNELLERLIGFGPDPVPGELLLRLHERDLSTNRGRSKPNHYCIDPDKLGLGITSPFLEMTW